MHINKKTERLLEIRKHPSFGVFQNPLLTVPKKAGVPPLPDPSTTGTLSAADIDILYTVASYPATIWSIPASFNDLYINEFTEFINLKTQEEPSYYTAYQQTLALYNLLVQEMGPTAALGYLYNPNPVPVPENWLTVSNWVIQEFLSLFIISGNFRYYGWLNYPGWMGGPYNDPNNLPYRSINTPL